MTENDVMNSLKICSELETCEGCSYVDDPGYCKKSLMKAAYNVIKLQQDHLASASDDIRKLQLDKETLEEMVAVKYTTKQLVQAVNDILDDTVIEDHSSTIQSVVAFLRLIDADGYFAFLPDGTAEIRLSE